MCTPSSPFSELLWAWTCALRSSGPPCRPCPFCALVNCAQNHCQNVEPLLVQPWPYFCKKKRANTAIASIKYFIQRKYWILWEIWHKSQPSKCSLSVKNLIWFLAEWHPRWTTLQFNNQWMYLSFGWHIIACTNHPMFCFQLFSSCCWGSLRGRPWHLTPTLGLVVTLSATCFPVLSRRTCQTLWRVTLVAIVARTNPLIQNFAGFEICHFFKRVGLHRVIEDDDIGIRLPECQPFVLSTFPINQKNAFWCTFQSVRESTSPTSFTSSSCVSLMGTTVNNTVYRPSFTSFLPTIRPGWSKSLQETEEPTCWMCSIQTYGIGTLSCNDKSTLFLSERLPESPQTQNMSGSIQTNLCLLLPLSWWFKPYLLRAVFNRWFFAIKPALHLSPHRLLDNHHYVVKSLSYFLKSFSICRQ